MREISDSDRTPASGLQAPAGAGSRAEADGPDGFHRRLHHVVPELLDPETAQTAGMRRLAAVSGKTVGSRKLWMGQTHVAPATRSADHHHGESETAIYVVSGRPVFVFLEGEGDDAKEVRVETKPGDYIFVPPYLPHREENPDPEHEAVVVIARSTQEAIVVNLPDLRSRTTAETDPDD
ncbi:Cupin 2 conserved barrel domain protein [Carbonactinospora thermoautotrophica]|uniref:Cupin 2 conserved barrel domain protein n=1 Tax=Carbonactinospora thermoautotrophica TaxID=1469144 RepID=A0A132MYK3_9ACTN|nr:cupin domain-containing protein [Carbonactinospora thermoautotrophica]KWX02978.1 Cupin 2 conserved barrel domain protein [Carbonactinospora thermoautotrophica]